MVILLDLNLQEKLAFCTTNYSSFSQIDNTLPAWVSKFFLMKSFLDNSSGI